MLILLGVAVVVAGFAAGFNPLLVVVVSALATGWAAGLERAGLQDHARDMIGRFRKVTLARLLIGYLLVRQITAALGLLSIAGQAQTIRPMVAPMAEAAMEADVGILPEHRLQAIRAFAAATDNIGVFFGEDIFLAVGSVLLMVGFLAQSGVSLEPLQLTVWAIPTAIAAFLIHSLRLVLFERKQRHMPVEAPSPP
jgi:uncharacterized membrane protein